MRLSAACTNRYPYHITSPFLTTQWSDGTVEPLGKEVIGTFGALTSEREMYYEEWPDLLPVIQSVLSNAPSEHRKNIAPFTAFMGVTLTSPIASFIHSTTQRPMNTTIVILECLGSINKLLLV